MAIGVTCVSGFLSRHQITLDTVLVKGDKGWDRVWEGAGRRAVYIVIKVDFCVW